MDIWPEGSSKLGIRMYNRKIWFTQHIVGEEGHFPYPSEKDHWAETKNGSYSKGDHTLRIEYKLSQNQVKILWDSDLVGHYEILKKSSISPMKKIKIDNMNQAIIRYKHE